MLWGSNFESCVWMAVSSHSFHHHQTCATVLSWLFHWQPAKFTLESEFLSNHLQEVLLAQFSLYVHKDGLKPHSFIFISTNFSCLTHNYRADTAHFCWMWSKFISFPSSPGHWHASAYCRSLAVSSTTIYYICICRRHGAKGSYLTLVRVADRIL